MEREALMMFSWSVFFAVVSIGFSLIGLLVVAEWRMEEKRQRLSGIGIGPRAQAMMRFRARRNIERDEAIADHLLQVALTTEYRFPQPDDPLVAEFDALALAEKRRLCEHRPDDHWTYCYINPPCVHCGMEVEKARWLTCPLCGHQAYYPRGVVPECAVCKQRNARR